MKHITLWAVFLIWSSFYCSKPKSYYTHKNNKHIYALYLENAASIYTPYEAKPATQFLPSETDIRQIEERLPNCENPDNALKEAILSNNSGQTGFNFAKYIRQYYGVQKTERTFAIVLIDEELFRKKQHPNIELFRPQDEFRGSRGCKHLKGVISLSLNICTLSCDMVRK